IIRETLRVRAEDRSHRSVPGGDQDLSGQRETPLSAGSSVRGCRRYHRSPDAFPLGGGIRPDVCIGAEDDNIGGATQKADAVTACPWGARRLEWLRAFPGKLAGLPATARGIRRDAASVRRPGRD